MSTYKYQQGIGSVGAYQVSGTPYMTGSVVENGNGATPPASQFKISFPKVAKTLRLINTGSAPLRFHFADITVSPALLDVKCKDFYVSSVNLGQSGFQLLAELTSIPASDMYPLSGSGINGDGTIS